MFSFVNTDLEGDIALSMNRTKFVATLSKMELSKSTKVMNPMTVLQSLIENYDAFLAYCSYGSYDEMYDYGSSSELCQDEEGAQFNEDIKLGHAKLVSNSTSKTIFVIGFSLFDSINATEIDNSYEKLTNLFKLRIAYF